MNPIFQSLGVKVDWGFTLTFASLIMARLAMVTATIPFLVGKPVPGAVRLGFTVMMTAFLYPYLKPSDPSVLTHAPVFLFVLFLKEAFYGIALGIAASIVFHAFESAGGLVDNQRGAAQARLLIPQLGEQSSIFGNFNYLLGIVVFLSLDGHLLFIKTIVESYNILPILTLPNANPDFMAVVDEFAKTTGNVLVIALQLTAPILIAIFMADVVMGIMSKAAPAINVWELSFMIRGVLGVLIYYLSVGLLISQMGKISLGMVGQLERLIHLLSLTPNQSL